MKKTIIGIDPGKQGGIGFHNDSKAYAVKMPPTVPEINKYLKYIIETYQNPIIFIEKVQAFKTDNDDSSGKMFGINKMLANYNQLLTVIQLLEIPYVEVYPISWQTTLKLKIKKDKRTKTERKRSYKEFAQSKFPLLKVNLATSDSLCLVQFGIEKWENDFSWIKERIRK